MKQLLDDIGFIEISNDYDVYTYKYADYILLITDYQTSLNMCSLYTINEILPNTQVFYTLSSNNYVIKERFLEHFKPILRKQKIEKLLNGTTIE